MKIYKIDLICDCGKVQKKNPTMGHDSSAVLPLNFRKAKV